MGMDLGFLAYERRTSQSEAPLERIRHYNEFHLYLSNEEQAEQAARCMECGVPYCQYGNELEGRTVGCPLGNLVPEFNDLLYLGKIQAAYERLIRTDSFPEFTSRVCPALCEKACTCSLDGDPVTTHENEFAIIETAFDRDLVKTLGEIPRTGKKVAVIGSGPAGLAAAVQLNMRGHTVHVYERSDRPGGLLMYGIPNMKLDKQIVMRRIDLMQKDGIEFRLNRNIDTKRRADDIIAGYDAVVLCCGASSARDIKAEGRDAEGIYFAVDFLASTTKALLNGGLKEGTYLSAKDRDVVIIGSGDTANDCLATAVRHGARSVLQMQRHQRTPLERTADNPWPEYPNVYVQGYGQEEAEALYGKDPSVYGATVNRFLKDDQGKLTGVEIIRMKEIVDRKSGKSSLQKVKGSEYIVPAQMVLIAAGFSGAESHVLRAFGVQADAKNRAATEKKGFATGREKVFAAGDVRRGASLVVWAIREGRDAAREVDEYLNGYTTLSRL